LDSWFHHLGSIFRAKTEREGDGIMAAFILIIGAVIVWLSATGKWASIMSVIKGKP
jgi:hypothetical protein